MDLAFPILFGRWKVSVYSQLLLGVVGPAIAFLFEPVTVTTQNRGNRGEVVLDFSGIQTSNAQSGFVFGAAYSLGVHIALEFYLPARWYSPWKFKWLSVVEKRFTFTIDLCNLLVKVIRYLIMRSPNGAQKGDMGAAPGNPLGRVLNGALSFRLFDEVNERFPASQTLTPAPRLTIPWNLADYVPVLAQFVKALQAIKGDLVVGPTVSVQFPTTLSLRHFTVEGGQSAGSTADYGQLDYTSTTVTGSGPPFNTSVTPTRLFTRVSYRTQVGVLLSALFYVSVAKIFSRGYNTPSLDLLSLLRPAAAATANARLDPQFRIVPALEPAGRPRASVEVVGSEPGGQPGADPRPRTEQDQRRASQPMDWPWAAARQPQ
jgi:hypothetical protein